jgi:hypothetical protein
VFDVGNHTRNLSSDTEQFSSLSPAAAILIVDIIQAISSVLRWRQSSETLLTKILARLAEAESFELKHEEFAFALWPHLIETRRQEKFSRWLSTLKEDQKLSTLNLVWVENRRTKRNEEGEFKGLPTLYKRGKFWDLFQCVQFIAKQCDLLSFPVQNRRAQVRDIVANWLKEVGASQIEREKKTLEAKPAKPTLPCSCACISCQGCSAKAPILPSSLPSSEPVLSVQIEEEKKKIRLIEDELVAIGQRRLNRGDKLSIVDNKINAVSVAARMRIKAAVNRSDGRDDYANEAGARARGRASQEIAVAELRAMKREAEEMGELKHAAKLAEFASVLESWHLFQSRKGVTLNGGQPK